MNFCSSLHVCLQVRWWWYDREEIGTNDFVCNKSDQKDATNILWPKECTCSCCTTLERLTHQTWKTGLQPAPVLARHDTMLLASVCFKGRCCTPHVLIGLVHAHTFPIHFFTLVSMVELSFVHVQFCNTVWLKRSMCMCVCVCVLLLLLLLWKDNTSHFSANWCATVNYVGMVVEWCGRVMECISLCCMALLVCVYFVNQCIHWAIPTSARFDTPTHCSTSIHSVVIYIFRGHIEHGCYCGNGLLHSWGCLASSPGSSHGQRKKRAWYKLHVHVRN